MRFSQTCNGMPRGALTEQQILVIEQQLSVHLPKDYRDFLGQWNGATFAPCYATFLYQDLDKHTANVPPYSEWHERVLLGDDGASQLSELFGFGVQEARDVVEDQEIVRPWIPTRFISIGFPTAVYDRICLSTDSSDCGEIFYWCFPHAAKPGVPDMSSMYWIASSFGEFWDSLHPIWNEDEFLELTG